jgi:uncharacterized membrane protein YhaH (DUF805 family)
MHWMLMPLNRYADFSGRSCRREYWLFGLLQFILLIFAAIALVFFGVSKDEIETSENGIFALVFISVIYLLVFLVPNISVTVRRLHDQGHTGWLYLISFIPYIGGLIIFVMMFLPGTSGPNQYGDDPR